MPVFFHTMDITDEILTRKEQAEDYLSTKYDTWDVYEQLFHNDTADAISGKTKSRVSDPKLSTLVLERSYRVMAQLPTGKIKAISKNDLGAAQLMNLIVDKYVNVNANAQFDFLTKLRMVDMYSNIYGNFFALIDWDVKKNGYVGPDMWLLNIRDVFPQVGAVSLEDSDYVIVRSWQPMSFFENLGKRQGYKNIDKIITSLKDLSGSKHAREQSEKSTREAQMYGGNTDPAKGAGYFEVLSQYEGDRWVDYVVDADEVFRDTDNPHDNGELPIVCKYSIPLIDDFMGMGDFERGASLQNVVNSVWNLYLDAVKMSIFPPVILNKDNMSVPSSFQYIAAAKWLSRGQIQNTAMPIQLTPRGIETFNNTYNIANGSLLNLFGTTDTSVTQEVEAGFGKTPQALKMQSQRENTRDNADRFFMEQFVKNVYKKMVNLVSKKQASAVTLRMFNEEVEELMRGYPEIKEMFDEKTGKLTISKSKVGNTLYDYEIVSGSTYALDQKSQQDNMLQLFQMFTANPQQGQMLMQTLDAEGYQMKIGELVKRMIASSGIQDWDKILIEKTQEEKIDTNLMQTRQQFEMAAQQIMGGSMNQVPPTPGQGQPMPPQGMPPQGGMPPQNGMQGQMPMMPNDQMV